LREIAHVTPVHPRAEKWGRKHLSLDGTELESWCRRVWWAAAAGELLRTYLYDPSRKNEVFDLVKTNEWPTVEAAHAKGGVILAAAHIGPPRLGMCMTVDRVNMPLIYSNSKETPQWLLDGGHYFQHKSSAQKTEAMVKAALHLRKGGLMFAAPDSGQSKDQIYIEAYNKRWSFAPGIAALARMMKVPSLATLALWEGETIELRVKRLEMPCATLAPIEWHCVWVTNYWNTIKPIVASSPENLRFLTNKIAKDLEP
jgi:lauroyl/myristoyl acyltransferase